MGVVCWSCCRPSFFPRSHFGLLFFVSRVKKEGKNRYSGRQVGGTFNGNENQTRRVNIKRGIRGVLDLSWVVILTTYAHTRHGTINTK